MALDYPALLDDLREESDRLIEHLTPLREDQWDLPTPAQGWTIGDQVSHLSFFDDSAHLALVDPDEFRVDADELVAGGMDFPDRIAAKYRTIKPVNLIDWFSDSRRQLLAAFAGDDPKRRLPWFGPDMSVASSATARLMETWAHGQDVYDALDVPHPPSPGLRHIAHLGVATFGFAHALNGMTIPEEPVRVQLDSPEGEVWSWGPDDAAQRVTGPAADFVLVVTQRRHWTDTTLTAEGTVASGWLDIAQAFAGAPSRRSARVVLP
ncbi:TIGR03084 family metal-binding protein [Mycolicibacterium sp.]|uniref:TIGR03084 family metal-binding protein n=1 Tax=Mycolicibacterium sp. TaxID=2320850 RepID=UPI001A279596|nr:TIGR03084 family metal-binding protein [Mycolicibacterium sp.]MBJ7337578.1 TIGR03084 family protein [Mycolicibacterium sp.]